MGWTYFTYTKENVSVDDMQKIINQFSDNWFLFGEGKNRNEKPIRQSWGWSTIVDVGNPWHDWEDEHGLGTIGVVTVGGAGFSAGLGENVNEFVVNKLREFGYTILRVDFSH